MNSPVLVIGTGRSGTSFTARLLEELFDVDMGGPGFKHESNPEGDYEQEYLKNAGRLRWEQVITPAEWQARVERFAANREGTLWGYKDPNMSWFAEDWARLFPDAPVIWAWRRLDLCADSCSRWYGWPPESALKEMARRQQTLAETFLRPGRPLLWLDFSERREADDVASELAWILDHPRVAGWRWMP